MRLDALFRPRSIAVIGASEKPTIGRRLIVSLDRLGFGGAIFPVNPNYQSVLGRQCYPSIAELPEAPDVAVFCLGDPLLLHALLPAAPSRHFAPEVLYRGLVPARPPGPAAPQPNARDCPHAPHPPLR